MPVHVPLCAGVDVRVTACARVNMPVTVHVNVRVPVRAHVLKGLTHSEFRAFVLEMPFPPLPDGNNRDRG